MRTQILMSISLLCAGCQVTTMGPVGTLDAPSTAPACKGAGGSNNRDDCTIFVVVKETGLGCTVDALPSQKTVDFDLGYENKWILWRFDASSAPGYTFTRAPKPAGIEFYRDPTKPFKPCNATGGGDGFQCLNRNDRLLSWGDYPYYIRVEHASKGTSCEKDPFIRNE